MQLIGKTAPFPGAPHIEIADSLQYYGAHAAVHDKGSREPSANQCQNQNELPKRGALLGKSFHKTKLLFPIV